MQWFVVVFFRTAWITSGLLIDSNLMTMFSGWVSNSKNSRVRYDQVTTHPSSIAVWGIKQFELHYKFELFKYEFELHYLRVRVKSSSYKCFVMSLME